MPQQVCPCGSQSFYSTCCEPLHKTQQLAKNPEQLMRSRYSAFVFGLGDYLLNTHHPDTRGHLKAEELGQLGEQTDWVGLQILSTEQLSPESGTVEFKAWFKDGSKIKALHENSMFFKIDKHWYYHSGELYKADEAGRNSPCPCGSGLKAKRCHLK